MSQKVCVLISCMHQQDCSIVSKTNVQSDCVVVNQCDKDKREEYYFVNNAGEECKVIFISTTERGLSRSRNLAINNATSDICVICDDDEQLVDNYTDIIVSAYSLHVKADIMLFALKWVDGNKRNKRLPHSSKRLNLIDILRTTSGQITFRRETIQHHGLKFDMKMGSGTGNGGGEEVKFLMDCRRMGLGLFYNPSIIAKVEKGPSQWFKGYTASYFVNHGWTSRRILTSVPSLLYIMYFVVSHYKLFKDDISFFSVLKNELKGWALKR